MASACAWEHLGLLSALLFWLGQPLPSSSISQTQDAEKDQPLPFASLGRFLRKIELEGSIRRRDWINLVGRTSHNPPASILWDTQVSFSVTD